MAESPHDFQEATFKRPTYCAFCNGFIWGLRKQGHTCNGCGFSVHRKCIYNVKPDCNLPGSCLKPHVVAEGDQDKSEYASTPDADQGAATDNPHGFELVSFTRPTYCGVCSKLIVGLVKQGLRCAICGFPVHKKCVMHSLQCREQDRIAFGALSIGDVRTLGEDDGKLSIKIDTALVATLKEEGYDAQELLSAIYALEEEGRPVTADSVRGQVRDTWAKKSLESSSESKGNLCVVCFEEAISTLLLPCKHVCTCATCSPLIDSCPICRAPVESSVGGIYLSGTK